MCSMCSFLFQKACRGGSCRSARTIQNASTCHYYCVKFMMRLMFATRSWRLGIHDCAVRRTTKIPAKISTFLCPPATTTTVASDRDASITRSRNRNSYLKYDPQRRIFHRLPQVEPVLSSAADLAQQPERILEACNFTKAARIAPHPVTNCRAALDFACSSYDGTACIFLFQCLIRQRHRYTCSLYYDPLLRASTMETRLKGLFAARGSRRNMYVRSRILRTLSSLPLIFSL